MTIAVSAIDFDTDACRLRVTGKNVEQNQHVKVGYLIEVSCSFSVPLVQLTFSLQMGQYHTIELELNRKFTIIKQEWDTIALERIGKTFFM